MSNVYKGLPRECPFKVGDLVVPRPGALRPGWDYSSMSWVEGLGDIDTDTRIKFIFEGRPPRPPYRVRRVMGASCELEGAIPDIIWVRLMSVTDLAPQVPQEVKITYYSGKRMVVVKQEIA